MANAPDGLPIISSTGELEDSAGVPSFLLRDPSQAGEVKPFYSCNYCGVGDSGVLRPGPRPEPKPGDIPASGDGAVRLKLHGQDVRLPASFREKDRIEVATSVPLAGEGDPVQVKLEYGGKSKNVTAFAKELLRSEDGVLLGQTFSIHKNGSTPSPVISRRLPTAGCVKFDISMGVQRPVFPYHAAPSVLDVTGRRVPITYREAIERFAEYLLNHRGAHDRTLLYACGQVDYFTIFAIQEVFRLLGVRNIGGNAEHCLNAGAVHNEVLTGQEGPFLTMEAALKCDNAFYLFNGWNGLITHPPAFHGLLNREDLDAYLIDVCLTESGKAVAERLGQDRVLLIKPCTDPHLALAAAHQIFRAHAGAIEMRFIRRFSDPKTFHRYADIARREEFSPEAVARRIAPEKQYEKRILDAVKDIAAKAADPARAPINIPSVGLSQSKGAVPHCLWGDFMAILGKYGLKPDGTPAGGTLRLPGQINAQTEVQGLGRNIFFGRIPVTEGGAVEAARRMQLPDHAYRKVLDRDPPRAVLDYSDPTALGETELIVIIGTQYESNMMNRSRWIKKLTKKDTTTLVVIDPIPDPFTLKWADLYIPAPPHAASAKLYQNGEWRLTLSLPSKKRPKETRTDATILYDAMAEVSRRLRGDGSVMAKHPDLKAVVRSGYLRHRFESLEAGGKLPRLDGEVVRPVLWDRIQEYLRGGGESGAVGGGSSVGQRAGDLYCRPEFADGKIISWEDLLREGSIVYGGVGTTRYKLDYDDPECVPFRDLYRRPGKFRFFVPNDRDLVLPSGILLITGRSSLSDDKSRIKFATATYNSGKHTSALYMPEENPLYISPALAEKYGLRANDHVKVTNKETGNSLILPVMPSYRVKGETMYVSFHKCRAELKLGRYVNQLTSHTHRCPYTDQTIMKATEVTIERVEGVNERRG